MPSSRIELQQFWKAQVQAFRESGQTLSFGANPQQIEAKVLDQKKR